MASKRSLRIADSSAANVAKRRNLPLTIEEKVDILKRNYAGFSPKKLSEEYDISVHTITGLKGHQDKILKRYAESQYITMCDEIRMKDAKNMCKNIKRSAVKESTNNKNVVYLTENDLFLAFCMDDYTLTNEPTEEEGPDFVSSDNESDTENDKSYPGSDNKSEPGNDNKSDPESDNKSEPGIDIKSEPGIDIKSEPESDNKSDTDRNMSQGGNLY
nr:uncharacterized protein LOC123771668 isoform X2 [Procambarus clarkii]